MKIIHKYKLSFIPAGLLVVTLLSGYFLSTVMPGASAANNGSSTASVKVGVSCNMTGEIVEVDGVEQVHEATIINGQYQENIGKTRLKTICNDTSGYAIYAVGYSNDTYGDTQMKPTTTSEVINTGSWTTSGDTSVWTMKLSVDTGSYSYGNLSILSDTNGSYASNHAVPTSYTKVANYTSSTDGSIGSSIFTTYAAYVAQPQAADTYVGKVRYLMVHPNAVNPTTLEIYFDTTKIQSVAVKSGSASGATVATVSTSGGAATGLQYGVNYYLVPTFRSGYGFSAWANGVDAVGSLSATDVENPYYTIGEGTNSVELLAREVKSLQINFDSTMANSIAVRSGSASGTTVGTISTSGSAVEGLIPGTTYYLVPDIKDGYEFVSWANGASSTGTLGATNTQNTSYTIGSGANLVTLNAKSSVLYIQNVNLTSCQKNVSNGIGEEIDVVDERDGKAYKVRYINGACWMTTNLRFLGNTGSATGKMTMTSSTSNGANTTIDLYSLNSSNNGSFGAYSGHCDSTNGYNYACVYDSGSETTGVWYNYNAATAGNITTNSNQTGVSASGPSVCPAGWHLPTGAAHTTSSEFYKIFQNTTSGSWVVASDYAKAFNAVPGGFYRNGSLYNEAYGFWWSATANGASYRYYLNYNSSTTQFYSNNNYRYSGFFVRCVRTS